VTTALLDLHSEIFPSPDLGDIKDEELVAQALGKMVRVVKFLREVRPLLIEIQKRWREAKKAKRPYMGYTNWDTFCEKEFHYTGRHCNGIAAGKISDELPTPPSKERRAFLEVREEAEKRFQANTSKAFQRHMREVWEERDPQPKIKSLDGARVVEVTNEEAAKIILKYEWLGTMASGTIASFGLMLNDELLGVGCFGKNGSVEALQAINDDTSKVICLVRGACVPHAPKNAASYLIRWACKEASKKYGWSHFIGYSDEQASEFGVVYQAANWKNLGKAEQGEKKSFTSPDGSVKFSSYQFNKKNDKKFYDLGWDGQEGKYDFLRRLGYTEQSEAIKDRWLWVDKFASKTKQPESTQVADDGLEDLFSPRPEDAPQPPTDVATVPSPEAVEKLNEAMSLLKEVWEIRSEIPADDFETWAEIAKLAKEISNLAAEYHLKFARAAGTALNALEVEEAA
jgi:hypothetical protein